MALHFEDLWMEAESVLDSASISDSETIDRIRVLLKRYEQASGLDFSVSLRSVVLGEILLNCAALSKKEDINVYDSLARAIKSFKINKINQ